MAQPADPAPSKGAELRQDGQREQDPGNRAGGRRSRATQHVGLQWLLGLSQQDIAAKHRETGRIAFDSIVEFSWTYARILSSFGYRAGSQLTTRAETRTSSCRKLKPEVNRCLQLTHLEQEAVVSVSDEPLCLRTSGPIHA